MVHSQAEKCSLLSFGANLALAGFKLVVGLLSGSTALLADAGNTLSDVFATWVALIGIRFGQRPPDRDHPLGHGNAEAMAALAISTVIFLTGVGLAAMAIVVVVKGGYNRPDVLALWTAAASIVIKEALYQYTIRIAKKLNSPALISVAKDHRADALSSVAALIGIAAGRYGTNVLDPVAGILIGTFIMHMGYNMLLRNANILMATSPGPDIELKIMKALHGLQGIKGVHAVKAQQIGSYYSVLLDITVDKKLTVEQGHFIAKDAKARVLEADPNIREITVHVDPDLLPDGEGESGTPQGSTGA